MILTGLFIAIFVALFTQPTAQRFYAGAVFIIVALAHELFLSDLDGLAYYGSAALFDLLIIVLMMGVKPTPRMVIELQAICWVSIVANFLGWVLWQKYLPADAYNAAFVIIYSWALVAFVKKDRADVGGYTMDCWRSCFRFRHRPCDYINHNDAGRL